MPAVSLIKRLVDAVVNTEERLTRIEKAVAETAESVNSLVKLIGKPVGFVTFAGQTPTKTEALKNQVANNRHLQVAEVMLECQFSQAIYMGVRPEHNAKLEELFEAAQLGEMATLLEQAKRLDELNVLARSNIKKVDGLLEDAEKRVQIESEGSIGQMVEKILTKTEEDRTETEKSKLLVEKALKRVELALAKAEMLTAKASNVIAVSEKPRKIFTVGK